MKAVLYLALFAVFVPAMLVVTNPNSLKPISLVEAEHGSNSAYIKYRLKTHYNHDGKLTELSTMLAEPGAADEAGNLKQLVAISARTGKQRITKLPGGPYDIKTLMQGYGNKTDIYQKILPLAKAKVPQSCPCTGADCTPGKTPFFITYGPPASGKGYVIGIIEKQMYGKNGCIAEAQVDEMVDMVPQKKNAPNPKTAQDMYWIFRDIGEKICDAVIGHAETQKVPIVFEMCQPDAWTKAHVTNAAFKTNYMSHLIFPMVTPALVFERSYARQAKAGRLPDVKIIQGAFEASTSKFVSFAEQLDMAVVYNNDNAVPKALATFKSGAWTIAPEVQSRCLFKTNPQTSWTGAGEKPAYLTNADVAVASLSDTISTFFCGLCCKGTTDQKKACKC